MKRSSTMPPADSPSSDNALPRDVKAKDTLDDDGLRDLPLTTYLDSLSNNPAFIVDVAQAPHYSTAAAAEEAVARGQPPVRPYDNPCMSRIFGEKRWFIEVLLPSSVERLRAFIFSLSDTFASQREFTLDFRVPDPRRSLEAEKIYNVVTVTFNVGWIECKSLPPQSQAKYPRGLLVCVGTLAQSDIELPPVPQKKTSSSSAYPVKDAFGPGQQRTSPSTEASPAQTPSINEVAIVSSFDWSGMQASSADLHDTEMGNMLLNHPWHETSLGPLESWPSYYRNYAFLCLSLPSAACIGLGPDRIFLYNDKYRGLLGPGHPYIFGKPAAVGWGETWDVIEPVVSRVMSERKAFSKQNHLVWMQRLDRWQDMRQGQVEDLPRFYSNESSLEETYHSFSYSPLLSDFDSSAVGFLGIDVETTATVIAQRRLETVRELGLAIAPAPNPASFYHSIQASLTTNPLDVPFVLVYSCTMRRGTDNSAPDGADDATVLQPSSGYRRTITGTGSTPEDTTSDHGSMTSGNLMLRLQSYCGLPEDNVRQYQQFSVLLDERGIKNDADLPFPFHAAVKGSSPRHHNLSEATMQHFAARSWDQHTHHAVTCPVRTDHKIVPDMIIVIGLNSRRPYNSLYRRFVEELMRALSSGLSTVRNLAREQRHHRNLQKLDEAKTTFFTGVSHELRSPLTLIAGPSQDALMEEDLRPRDKQRYGLIARATGRLLRLVNSLLDFASAEAGKLSVTFQPVLLSGFVEDLASLFRSAAERAGLKYNVRCIGQEIAYTDVMAYEKILYNLISNALKYTRAGGVDISLHSTEHNHILEVSDTGIGIPADELSRIFRRFHRVKNSQARSIEGTGIGLALTRELARVIKGQLTVESQLATDGKPGGSRFRFTIPTGYNHLPEELIQFDETPVGLGNIGNGYSRMAIADELSNAFEGAGAMSVDGTNDSAHMDADELVSGREASVLVVDDNDDVRAYVSSILGSVCRSVTAVNDGSAALAILKTNARIDLVVSDIQMPRMNGFELLSAIRSDERLQSLPVILLSARAGPEASAEGIEKGGTDYLPKPFSSKELTARVRNALQTAKNSLRLEALVEERTAELVASEKRSETLMSVLPVGVYEANADGLVTWANPTWKRMSQWPDDRIPFHASEWLDKVQESDRARITSIFERSFYASDEDRALSDEPMAADWQWQYSCSPGREPSWCFGQLYPRGDGFIGVLTDITPTKRLTEQALAHEKQRTTDALNLARSQESFLDVVSHELRNPLSAILNAADLANANHEAIAVCLDNLSDAADLELSQRVIEEARSELDEAAESVQGIVASARHQSLIAGDILSVSRFNRGLLTITPVDISLMSELQTIMSMFEIQTRNNNIALRLGHGANIDQNFCVQADPTRLNQILVNLISNSCRILESYEGERQCAVEVRALSHPPTLSVFHEGTDKTLQELADSADSTPSNPPIGSDLWLLFLVRDTGPGISAQTQARLFTKFNQVQDKASAMDNTRSAVGGGAGLGLYLAKKLAELMGGSITVVSEEGKGADFIFYIKSARARFVESKRSIRSSRLRLPKLAGRTGDSLSSPQSLSGRSSFSTVASPESRAMNLDEGHPLSSPGSQSGSSVIAASPPKRRPLRVLVVEDNLLNQKLLHRQLVKSGVGVTTANNGLEAIERVRSASNDKLPIDVCLMDLEMPLMGGLEACIKIRELERQKILQERVKIFAVTGNAREHFVTEAKKAGMDDVITKPYRFPEIMSKLDALEILG